MKKYWMVCLLVMVAMMLVMMPLALAEAVDAVPEAPIPALQNAEFFDIAMLGTFVGAAAAAEVLVLIVKWVFKLSGNGVRYTVLICSVLVVAAGKFLGGEPVTVASIILAILNGGVVASTLMKIYEVTAGHAETPAGTI